MNDEDAVFFERVATFREILVDCHEDNKEETAKRVLNHYFVQNQTNSAFIRNYQVIFEARPKQRKYLIEMLKILFNSSGIDFSKLKYSFFYSLFLRDQHKKTFNVLLESLINDRVFAANEFTGYLTRMIERKILDHEGQIKFFKAFSEAIKEGDRKLFINMENLLKMNKAILISKKAKQEHPIIETVIKDDLDQFQVLFNEIGPKKNKKFHHSIKNGILKDEHDLFCLAAFYGAFKILKFLFLSIERELLEYSHPVKYAMLGGDIQIIRFLEQNDFDFSDAIYAASAHQYDIMSWVINNKEDCLEFKGLLYQMAMSNNIFELETVFLKGKTETKITANVFSACFQNDPFEFIKCLVSMKLTKLLYNFVGMNPVATNGFTDLCELILKGDSLDIGEHYIEFPPILAASRNSCFDCVNLLAKNNTIDINVEDENKFSPLFHMIIKQSVKAIVTILHRDDLNIGHVDKYGRNALHHAVMTKNVDILKIVIDRINIESYDKDGLCPIHYAVQYGSMPITQLLIQNDLQILHLNDKMGRNLSALAQLSGNQEIIDYIKDKNNKL